MRFQPVPHFIPANAVEFAGGRRAVHVLAPTAARTGAVRLRRGHRPAADRGDAAAARARRTARAPHARGGGRARRAGGREAPGTDPLLRRARTPTGRAPRARAAFGAPGRRRTRRRGLRASAVKHRGPRGRLHPVVTLATAAMDGVRLLSHRPSVLYKVEHLASEPAAGDIGVEGLLLAGPGWDERLKAVIKALSISERACLFAVRLADEQSLPVPAETLLDRTPHGLVPRIPLARADAAALPADRRAARRPAFGREALMRGMLGTVELRGAELIAAAEAHDALFSFDYRARTAALEVGLPLLPDGRDPVRQPRPARGAGRRELDADHVADRRPPRRRPVADLPRDHQARALPGPRAAARTWSPSTASAAPGSPSMISPAGRTRSPASSCCAPTSPRSTWP